MFKIHSFQPETFNTRMNASQQILKQCRICLQQSSNSSNHTMIQPCRCSGTVKYVHEKCMITWILAALRDKDQEQKQDLIYRGIPCELCKFPIKCQSQINMKCRKIEKVCEFIQKKPQIFGIITAILISSLSGIGAISYALSQIVISYLAQKLSMFFIILAIIGLLLFLCFLALGLYLLITLLLIDKIIQILKIQSHSMQNIAQHRQSQTSYQNPGNSTQVYNSYQ